MTPVMLVAVRPGPVLHVWQDGRELAAIPLDTHAALALAEALLREVRANVR
ncbi:hypothetical protein SAMN05216257_101245 [Meinhardsimonia xiamenensis]|jgi:hypothetical protein|uniref:Uncharacterized protein n=1 Tax=Meinhardsimonia xiamenensis TaxID=990712 RepID=A0A1G8YAB2_9RHOB|nr:hypothetical protein [Meinhardsimonia xiamenensis]PRX37226.1 hypothetical protein LV81_01001 [Meinhardsimonia xiamenensis]SDJ99701.1 hypothetical protein SAMN05216257_101245 [Meinhardsimonia xiamenensis]